jgi:hypothetical protein
LSELLSTRDLRPLAWWLTAKTLPCAAVALRVRLVLQVDPEPHEITADPEATAARRESRDRIVRRHDVQYCVG